MTVHKTDVLATMLYILDQDEPLNFRDIKEGLEKAMRKKVNDRSFKNIMKKLRDENFLDYYPAKKTNKKGNPGRAYKLNKSGISALIQTMATLNRLQNK